MRSLLRKRIPDISSWKMTSVEIDLTNSELISKPVRKAIDDGLKVYALNLPACRGILSHFTQPGHIFADEISDRLKVIACIEKPNLTHSEDLNPLLTGREFAKIAAFTGAGEEDAQIVIWGPEADIPTALETVTERIQLAYEGVPNETRKTFADGTNMFERVLPGRDRMYPDTDSEPIPLTDEYIEELRERTPVLVSERYHQLKTWNVPADTYRYLLSKNMVPLIERISDNYGFSPQYIGTFLGQTFKNIEGRRRAHKNFSYEKIYGLFGFISKKKLIPSVARVMLPVIYDNPDMEFGSVLIAIDFRKYSINEIVASVDFLYKKFAQIRYNETEKAAIDWLMGQLRQQAVGNVELTELKSEIENKIRKGK
jgi:glutamyl-tRNA(Gln) amidotransferase subunit E